MKAPKILAVASAVDLDFRYGCTPAWWQLWKGLHEAGCDLIVTPYRGRPVESPWWRTAPNPCYREGEAFATARDLVARVKGDRYLRRAEDATPATRLDRLVREVIWRWVTPRWRSHLERLLERERDVDAVVVFTVPMSHLRGIPTLLRERFGVPVVFYDGDVPMSLPEFGGTDTGFNYYLGADPSEYDLVVSNSEGGLEPAPRAGRAPRRGGLLGRRPRALPAAPGRQGDGRLLLRLRRQVPRASGREAMIGEPSRRLPHVDFSLGGRDFRGDIGRARLVGDVPFNVFARAISAARINLNVTRRAHASVYASSTSRPFELAMAGAAIVSNPHEGIERWFEPGRELLVVENADEAVAAYRELLDDPGARRGAGPRRARARARRAHVPAPGAAAARAARRPCPGGRRWLSVAEQPAVQSADPRLAGLRRIAIVPAFNEEESIGA